MPVTSAWDAVPDELDERIMEVRRVEGLGPAGLWARFGDELAAYDVTQQDVHNRIYGRLKAKPDENADGVAARKVLSSVSALLQRSGIDPSEVERVRSIRLSESAWQGLTKNDGGEAEIHDLEGIRTAITLEPKWAEGPRWELVDRAPPVKITPPPRKRKPPDRAGREVAAIVPDLQIGHWRDLETGDLTPFHDEIAMATALAVIAASEPDVVIILGDGLDFAPMSEKFIKQPGFVLTTQPGIDRMGRFLADIRARIRPDARIVYIEGNHDRRLQKLITMNAIEAFGLRKARLNDTTLDDWPVMSVPNLCRFDDLGVEYVGGYPAGEYWINDNLVAIHGHKVRSAGSTASAVIDDERVSVLFGHVHRIERMHRTRRVRGGLRSSLAATLGCLCRLDGVVPSTKGSTDVFGRPVPTVENWQHGMGIVEYEPGDGRFALEEIPIHDGWALWRGQEFDVDVEEEA